MTNFQKAFCIVLSMCFFATLAVLPGALFTGENVYRHLPLYRFLEEKTQVHSYEDQETYEKIAGENGNEQAADFVINLIKTVRGYGAIFVSATQNVVDYFALNDGKFGDALLGNSRLKLLLQLEETEAVKLQEKLMLTESETAEVIRAGRGEGLLCAGRNRIAVEIRSSDTEFNLITTDRESLAKRVKTE